MKKILAWFGVTILILAIFVISAWFAFSIAPRLTGSWLDNDREWLVFDINFTEKKLLKAAIARNNKFEIEQLKSNIERYKATLDYLEKTTKLPEPYLCLTGYNISAIKSNNDGSVAIRVRFYEDGYDTVGVKFYYIDGGIEKAFSFPIINSDEYYDDNDRKEFGSSASRVRGFNLDVGTKFYYDEQTGDTEIPLEILFKGVSLSVYDNKSGESNRLELRMRDDVRQLITSQMERLNSQ